MNDQPKLGELLPPGTRYRDATHIPLEGVEAIQTLQPGQHVGLRGRNAETGCYLVGDSDDPIGVVDPLLKHPVCKGQSFLLLIYPGTITGLRHIWTSPAFAAARKEPS